jgi:hypothetical protein
MTRILKLQFLDQVIHATIEQLPVEDGARCYEATKESHTT